ncbi:MAG: transposase, partial [Desulfovibrionaceae bacterium]|nr:transposase [Desulfovibrionaceae bacterium]
MDFVTKKVITYTNDKYINATSVCELLRSISEANLGKAVHIILDNARYQRCKLVTELAEELGIVLEFLPSYSPNLNLIYR